MFEENSLKELLLVCTREVKGLTIQRKVGVELSDFNKGFPAPPSLLKRHTGTFGVSIVQHWKYFWEEQVTQTKTSSAKVKGEWIRREEWYKASKVPQLFREGWHGADVTKQMSVNYSSKYKPGAQKLALWYQGRIQGLCRQASNGLRCGLFYKQWQP